MHSFCQSVPNLGTRGDAVRQYYGTRQSNVNSAYLLLAGFPRRRHGAGDRSIWTESPWYQQISFSVEQTPCRAAESFSAAATLASKHIHTIFARRRKREYPGRCVAVRGRMIDNIVFAFIFCSAAADDPLSSSFPAAQMTSATMTRWNMCHLRCQMYKNFVPSVAEDREVSD